MTFGSLRTLGLTTFLLSIPIGVIATFLATRNVFASTEILIEWIGIAVISQLALGAVMWIAYRICAKFDGPTRRFAVIAAAVTAGAVRGATLALLAHQANLATTANIPVRTLSSAGIFGLWLLVIGATLQANDNYKAQLRDILRELIATDVITAARAPSSSQKVAADLDARIQGHAMAIRNALDASGVLGNPAASARVLRQGIEERIRPLSHELWHASRTPTSGIHAFRHFVTRALQTPPPVVWVAVTLGIVFVVNSLIWNEPVLGVVVGVTYSATFIAILLIGFRGRATVEPQRSIMTLLGLLVAPAAVVWVLAKLLDWSSPDASLVIMGVGGMAAVMFAMTGRTAIEDRARTLENLRAAIDSPLVVSEIKAAARRGLQERTATHLHNTVQSRLTAAALHLDHAAATHDDALAEATLSRARSVLASVPLPSEPLQDPHERLKEIVTAWSGIASITAEIPELSIELTRWHVAVDAIEEVVANSVRHGGASSIHVRIDVEGEDLVLTVSDNGEVARTPNTDGLGRLWLSELSSGMWHQVNTETGGTLTCRLPYRT